MIEEVSKIATELGVQYEITEYSPEPDNKCKILTIKDSNIQFYDLNTTVVARVMIQLRPEDGDRLMAMGEPMRKRAMLAISKAASHGPYYHSYELDEKGRIRMINIDRRAVFRASDIGSVQLFIDILQEIMERVMRVTEVLTDVLGTTPDISIPSPPTNDDRMYG